MGNYLPHVGDGEWECAVKGACKDSLISSASRKPFSWKSVFQMWDCWEEVQKCNELCAVYLVKSSLRWTWAHPKAKVRSDLSRPVLSIVDLPLLCQQLNKFLPFTNVSLNASPHPWLLGQTPGQAGPGFWLQIGTWMVAQHHAGSGGTQVPPFRLSAPSVLLRVSASPPARSPAPWGLCSQPLLPSGSKTWPCRGGGFPGCVLAVVRQQAWGTGGEWAGHVIKPVAILAALRHTPH